MFDRLGRVTETQVNTSYNAEFLGRSSSVALQLSPCLTPTILLFRYSPFYVEDTRSAVFMPEKKVAEYKDYHGDFPTEMLLLMEYYPYTQSIIHAIEANSRRNNYTGIQKDFGNHYPEYGYLRVHYLDSMPQNSTTVPEQLMIAKDLNDLCSALGISSSGYMGFCTEGVISTAALNNLNFNMIHATAKLACQQLPTNLPCLARYIPNNVGYEAIKEWYERYAFVGTSQFKISRPILFVNKRFRDKTAKPGYSATNYHDALFSTSQVRAQEANEWVAATDLHGNSCTQAKFYSQINDPIHSIISTRHAAEVVKNPPLISNDAFVHFNVTTARNDFTADIHLNQENLFPDSIVSSLYNNVIEKIKSADPLKQHVEEVLRRNLHYPSHPSAILIEKTASGFSRDAAKQGIDFSKRAAGFAKIPGQVGKLQHPASGHRGGGTTAGSWGGYANVLFPAADLVMSLNDVVALGDNPSDPWAWNGALQFFNSAASVNVGASALVSTAASHFAAHIAGPISSTLTVLTSIINDARKYSNAEKKLGQLACVLLKVHEALDIATSQDLAIRTEHGEEISRSVKQHVVADLKQLKELVGFVISRYELDKRWAAGLYVLDAVNLATLLFCAACSVVTAGASLVVAGVFTAITKGVKTLAASASRLSRYADKTLAYNQKYHDLQNELNGNGQRPRAFVYRDQNLLAWANELSGKGALRAQAVNPLAKISMVSGATIDDYQRIQLASFQISMALRFKLNSNQVNNQPLLRAYLAIVDAIGLCIGYDDRFLTKILLSMRLAWRDLSNFDFARVRLDAAYKQSVIYLAHQIR